MSHKNILILVFLINLNIIFSNNSCEEVESPTNEINCTSKTISNSKSYPDYCCFYEPVKNNNDNNNNINNTFCRTIPYSSFYQEVSYENINDQLYKVTCKSNEENPKTILEQCGNVKKANEADFEDCKEYSTLLNSCCFTKGNSNIKKGCYWLGTKYEGDINWAGVDMECNMNYLKYSLFYLIFIFSYIF